MVILNYTFLTWSSFILTLASYTGNTNLHEEKEGSKIGIIIGASVGAAVLLIVILASCIYMQKRKRRYSEQSKADFDLICHFLLIFIFARNKF